MKAEENKIWGFGGASFLIEQRLDDLNPALERRSGWQFYLHPKCTFRAMCCDAGEGKVQT